jgi:hypothetical protein
MRLAKLRRTGAATAAVALTLLLGACVGIPTGGPVGSVDIDLDDDGGDIITRADPPQPGATPTQLLAGFLTAQRAPQGNYSVARLYLTDSFRTEWSPSERVMVSDSPLVPEQVSETEFELDVSVEALVGPAGNYAELADSEQQSLGYGFERNAEGEWRISTAPPGILLSSAQFDRDFGAYPLYFHDPAVPSSCPTCGGSRTPPHAPTAS